MIPPAKWLDQNRPIEKMTWAPGEPPLVFNRLMLSQGWEAVPGVTTLNQYKPHIIREGDPRKARRWIKLVYRVFGREAKHIILWLAHRVQRPAEKINHGLVLGGAQGIGKDTILEPVRLAVGEENFHEISPQDIFGTFNSFTKSVILRVNEGRKQPIRLL